MSHSELYHHASEGDTVIRHQFPQHPFAATIGLDWADAKHDICLQVMGSDDTERFVLKHRPESIDAWARELRQRFGGQPVAVALELFKGPIVSALAKYDFFVLFPIDPATLAKYREIWTHSGAKDDPTDAELALEFLMKHPERFQPLNPQSPQMRALEQLNEHRRRLVDDQTRITNRLTDALKQYYPQPLQWFNDKATELFCDFLERWPTLKAAQLARRSTLERFFHEHNVRYPGIIERRTQAIKGASALTADEGVIAPYSLLVRALVGQLRATLSAIETFNSEINSCAHAHPDFFIFDSFPAAGPVFAPRLLSAFGEQRERYATATEIQKYAGIAPVTVRSGNSCWVHWRWQCPTFLRQTFVEWAALTIPRSFWAKAYYQQQRAKGQSHQAAVRSLAYKWIRILFRCWQTRTTYDESAYLNALKKRGSPLIHNLAD
jgi:transposase